MKAEPRAKYSYKMFINHLFIGVLSFLLATFIFRRINSSIIGANIFSSITLFLIFAYTYSYTYGNASKDKRAFDPNKPTVLNGLKVGLWGSFYILILLIPDVILRHVLSPSQIGYWEPFFEIWNAPYRAFVFPWNGAPPSYFNWILCALVPIFGGFFGYIAGLKKFSFSSIIYRLIYKKKG